MDGSHVAPGQLAWPEREFPRRGEHSAHRRASAIHRAALFAALSALALLPLHASAVQRFPQPDFASGYKVPTAQLVPPRAEWQEIADAAVLLFALSAAAWLALRSRSRKGLYLLSLFSLAYFGFYREGCICPVGSVQNIVLGIADPGYAAPLLVVVFFALPLVFALLFGRVFCASVCPLGAIQELFVFRPFRLPAWLSRCLELLPHLYLGLAVLFAATGAGFVICRYDPFVGLFRMSGRFSMIALGAVLLVLGLFVARPYCRFLCPYGVLLNWCSRLSARHLGITPDQCIQCRLCENACPYDAILKPRPPVYPGDRASARRRLARSLALLPLLVIAGAGAGRIAAPALSAVHPTRVLARELRAEDASGTKDTTWRTKAFRASGRTGAELDTEEQVVARRFAIGSTAVGAFLGLAIALRLAASASYRPQPDYVPDRGTCLSCGRCFAYCPREYVRLGITDGPMMNL
jgi:NosR/NirI family transcriptional regulator, nitrous oxide reductase regulator